MISFFYEGGAVNGAAPAAATAEATAAAPAMVGDACYFRVARTFLSLFSFPT